MPNFTNKAKLKKPLASEYFNIEDHNGNMDIIEQEFYTPIYSEELLNEDITSFKVGTGKVNDVAKDYSSLMEQSLIGLDNIQGKTEKNDGILQGINLRNIYIPEKEIKLNESNLIPKFSNTEYTFSNGALVVKATEASTYRHVRCKFDGLEDGNDYTLLIDVKTTGNPTVVVDGCDIDGNWLDIFSYYRYYKGKYIAQFTYKESLGFNLQFYASSSTPAGTGGGTVEFKNMTLIKHKETIHTGATDLHSLPNGVTDYVVNSVLTKKITEYTLTGYEDWKYSDTAKPNTNAFICKLPNAVKVSKSQIALNCNKHYEAVSDDVCYNQDKVCMAIGGDGSNQLVFRVSKSINNLTDFLRHLRVVERDITIQYETVAQNINVNMAILTEAGDTIAIDTPIALNCTHKVPFNTKSQIEELQRIVQQEKKSVWQKIYGLTNVQISIGKTAGYIKFPSILGDLLIQWGTSYDEPKSNPGTYFATQEFPLKFNKIYTVLYSPKMEDEASHKLGKHSLCTVDLHFFNVKYERIEGYHGTQFNWIAIGR